MAITLYSRLSSGARWASGLLLLTIIAGIATSGQWLPKAKQLFSPPTVVKHTDADHDSHEGEKNDAHEGEAEGKHAEADEHGHDEHKGETEASKATADGDQHDAHEEEGEAHRPAAGGHQHNEAASVSLSQAAQENVGVRTAKIELAPFERTITVPAMAIERPGRSHMQIAAPLTGVVTRIYPSQGEAVAPGQPMFDLRLTHEEVVEAQAAFLQTAEELDVIRREIERLEKVAANGAVAGKTLLERQYEQQKLEAHLRSQRQRLLLHGLTTSQVDGILANRTLLSEMTVFLPARDKTAAKADAPLFQVEDLKVDVGQHVKAGDLLCIVADYSELYIQGKAFEQDVTVLDRAANQDWRVTAVIPGDNQNRQKTPGLKILSLANTVDPESRALLFYVELPNKRIRDRRTADGRRFCAWQFKPGQRLELLVPVERWKNRIVLPRDAVIQDAAESYVFEKIDGHFERRAVRVEYSDQYSVVLANEGAITPGKTVVVAGAYQIFLALKNKSGGAPDPHAGHNH